MKLRIRKLPAQQVIKRLVDTTTSALPVQGRVSHMQVSTPLGQVDASAPAEGSVSEAQLAAGEMGMVCRWLGSREGADVERVVLGIDTRQGRSANLTFSRAVVCDQIEVDFPKLPIAQRIPMVDSLLAAWREDSAPDAPEHVADGSVGDDAQKLLVEVTERNLQATADLRYALGEGLKGFLGSLNEAQASFRAEVSARQAALVNEVDGERKHLKAEIDEERRSLRAEIDEERRRSEAELAEATSKLAGERAAFEKLRAEHDERRATFARREADAGLRKKLAEKAGVMMSPATNKKTWPVTSACVVVAVAAAVLVVASARVLFSGSTVAWYQVLPFSTGVVGFLTTAIYFIRFHQSWLDRHANLETRNQILELDMARASWLAELLFEYKDEKGVGLPDSVVQVLTKNLFELRALPEAVRHPAEDLAAFAERLQKIQVSKDGIEFDAKGK